MSSLKYSTVIVFGPTGGVGSAAALEAAKRGAKVYLAMRDPSKKIEGISEHDDKSLSFERIKADLTDPESVTAAIHKSRAKAAYIYSVPSPKPLTPTLKAMKEAGIEYVVFLSSYSITPDHKLREIQPNDIIAYMHGQIEIALEDMGVAHTALRPAFFASNPFKMFLVQGKKPLEANVFHEDYRCDLIAPTDIGRVGGAVLVNPPEEVASTGKKIIYLFGPKIRRNDEVFDVIKEVSGKDIKVNFCDEQEFNEHLKTKGLPPPIIATLIRNVKENRTKDIYPEPFYSETKGNVKKYTGYEPTQFEDFIKSYDLDSS